MQVTLVFIIPQGFLKPIFGNIRFSNSILKDFLWSISSLVTFKHLIIMKKYPVKKQNLLERNSSFEI